MGLLEVYLQDEFKETISVYNLQKVKQMYHNISRDGQISD